MKQASRLAMVNIGGLLASLMACGLLFAAKVAIHFDLYNVFARMVLPVGAILTGFFVALGFILGSRLSGYRPGRFLFISVIVAACVVHFGLKYLDYMTLADRGTPLRQVISFWAYVHYTVAGWQTNLGGRTTTNSGNGGSGYFIEGLQIAGFTAAATIFCAGLRGSSYCDACSGYLKNEKEAVRYLDDADLGRDKSERMAQLVRDSRLSAAVTEFSGYGEKTPVPEVTHRAKMTVSSCPKCDKKWIAFRVSTRDGELWMPQDEYRADGVSMERVDRTARI